MIELPSVIELVEITLVGGLDKLDHRSVLDHRTVIQPERAQRPPRLPLAEGLLADAAELAVGRGAQVDRSDPAAGRCRPGRAEELLAGGDQVVRPAASALGVEHEHVGVGGHQLGQHLHLVDEHRRERLHALHGDAGGDLVGQLDQLRVRLAELGRPAPYVIGEQQLAARRRPQPLDGLQGPLVRDGEGPDLLYVVAPELHPQRVFLGRREDVHDPAADGELAAPLDQVDARVRRIREASYDVVEVDGVALAQRHGLEVSESLDLRLKQRSDRRHDHPERTVVAGRTGVADPAEDRQPAADGVAARAEPLVRKRLPAWVVADEAGVDQVAELFDEVLGLAGGRRHREHRPAGVDQALDRERPQRRRTGQVEGRDGVRVAQRSSQGRIGEDSIGQSGEVHGFPFDSTTAPGHESTGGEGRQSTCAAACAAASASDRSTQNSLPSGSFITTQPTPGP